MPDDIRARTADAGLSARLRRALIGSLLAVPIATAGCAKTSQTPFMKELSPQELSSQELRGRLYGAVDRYNRLVSNNADLIRSESNDPEVHTAVLRWKLYATSHMLVAAFRMDPLLGFIDTWALATQMRMAFEPGGLLENMFDEQSERAIEATQRGEALFVELAPVMLEDHEPMRQRVLEWAPEYPIGDLRLGRTSVLDVAERAPAAQYRTSAFGVGEMQTTMEDLNARAPMLLEAAIQRTLWAMELLWTERGLDGSVASIVEDAGSIDTSASRIADGVDSVVAALGQLDSLSWVIERERTAVLLDLDRQRVETLSALSAERIAVLDAIDVQFTAMLETLSSERALIMAAADSITDGKIDLAVVGLRDVADHVFWRAVQLLAIAAVLALIVGCRLAVDPKETADGGVGRGLQLRRHADTQLVSDEIRLEAAAIVC
jgi:hypothetical protein